MKNSTRRIVAFLLSVLLSFSALCALSPALSAQETDPLTEALGTLAAKWLGTRPSDANALLLTCEEIPNAMPYLNELWAEYSERSDVLTVAEAAAEIADTIELYYAPSRLLNPSAASPALQDPRAAWSMLYNCYRFVLDRAFLHNALQRMQALAASEGKRDLAGLLEPVGIHYMDVFFVEQYYETFYVDEEKMVTIPNAANRIAEYLYDGYDEILTEDAEKYLPELLKEDDRLTIDVINAYFYVLDDRFASYYTPDLMLKEEESEAEYYVGIGVTVTWSNDDTVAIINITEQSPAEKAGLRIDDEILAVDGVSCAVLGYQEAIKHVRGEEGTTVCLTIKRGDEIFDVDVFRETVTNYTVVHRMLRDGIGYVRISQFTNSTWSQFITAVEELEAAGAVGYIFDVRNNPGGYVSSVENILAWILPDSCEAVPDGALIHFDYKNDEDNETDTVATAADPAVASHTLDGEIVVLCNGNSASAAEIFISTLRDWNRATVVGTQTFGKGVGQVGYYLIGTGACTYSRPKANLRGSVLYLTGFYYAPPTSPNYHGVGIAPDVLSELPEEWQNVNPYRVPEEEDTVLQTGIVTLQALLSGSSSGTGSGGEAETSAGSGGTTGNDKVGEKIFAVVIAMMIAVCGILGASILITLFFGKKRKAAGETVRPENDPLPLQDGNNTPNDPNGDQQ